MTKMTIMNMLIMLMLIIIMILISNYFIHPIIMMSLILIYSMITCIIMTLWSFNYIYSIVMFLIMVSGILILFMYFTSLISNEQHKIYLFKIMYLSSIMMILMMIFKSNSLFESYQWSFDMLTQKNLETCPFQYLFKLYNYPNNYMTIMCILFLLMSLLLIIKISSSKYSSLRKIT